MSTNQEYYELPEGTANPAYIAGVDRDSPLTYYPRTVNLVNGFTAPDSGLVIAQVVGTGSVLKININNVPYVFNAGVALTNGALYEFDVHVRAGEIVQVDTTTCTLRALFFRRGE